MQQRRIIIGIVFIFTIAGLTYYTHACELDQTQYGCRIDNGQCTCAFGCKSEFRYATRKECQDALKGRSGDICSRAPCLNNGSCTQVTAMPQYKCRCEGTGYWGTRCQRLCPKPEQVPAGSKYPHECVVIWIKARNDFFITFHWMDVYRTIMHHSNSADRKESEGTPTISLNQYQQKW